jgi:hypothetical protein
MTIKMKTSLMVMAGLSRGLPNTFRKMGTLIRTSNTGGPAKDITNTGTPNRMAR